MTPPDPLTIRARNLGERLDLRTFSEGEIVLRSPLTLRTDDGGWAVLFRYGSAVLAGVTPEAEAALLDALGPRTSGPFADTQLEELTVVVDPAAPQRMDADGVLHVSAADVGHVLVVAEVLAKSTALAHHEAAVGEVLGEMEPLVASLRSRGRRRARTRSVLSQLGKVMRTQAHLMGRVEVDEKPEITWDDPDLDQLYERLATEFELQERARALTRKTDFIWESADLLISMTQHRQTLRVEWYIVILIVIEIVLLVVELWSR